MRPWLLVGAMRVETFPVLRRLTAPRPIGPRLWLGSVNARPVALLTCGVGLERAERRGLEAIERLDPEVVVSFGTCGALIDGLPRGALVGATGLVHRAEAEVPLTPPPCPGLHLGALASVAEVVATPKARAALAARGAVACEMEAAGVRRAARDRPFYALKVVSDAAGGDPNERLEPGDPVQILRFKALALNLVEGHLAPALVSWVGGL
jgi:nucleoside phosphorylase